MKKIIVIFIIFVAIFVVYSIGEQIYYYYKNDKNNFEIVITDGRITGNDICVIVDDSVLYHKKLIEYPMDFKSMPLKLGPHKIEVKINDSIYYEKKFWVLLNKWVLIDKVGYNDRSYSIRMKSTPFMIE